MIHITIMHWIRLLLKALEGGDQEIGEKSNGTYQLWVHQNPSSIEEIMKNDKLLLIRWALWWKPSSQEVIYGDTATEPDYRYDNENIPLGISDNYDLRGSFLYGRARRLAALQRESSKAVRWVHYCFLFSKTTYPNWKNETSSIPCRYRINSHPPVNRPWQDEN